MVKKITIKFFIVLFCNCCLQEAVTAACNASAEAAMSMYNERLSRKTSGLFARRLGASHWAAREDAINMYNNNRYKNTAIGKKRLQTLIEVSIHFVFATIL